jgi:hypothetical protein
MVPRLSMPPPALQAKEKASTRLALLHSACVLLALGQTLLRYQGTFGNDQALSDAGADFSFDFPHGRAFDDGNLLNGGYDVAQFGAQILGTAFD